MNAKEAVLMLKLGVKLKRPYWEGETYITLGPNDTICVKDPDGDITKDTVEGFLTQKWTDWEVYCPQDNK